MGSGTFDTDCIFVAVGERVSMGLAAIIFLGFVLPVDLYIFNEANMVDVGEVCARYEGIILTTSSGSVLSAQP